MGSKVQRGGKEREKETMDNMPVLNYEWLYGVYKYFEGYNRTGKSFMLNIMH